MAAQAYLNPFQLVSFGCKVNQAEGEALAAALRARGLREAPAGGGPAFVGDGTLPDAGAAPAVVIVNTCAVTAEAVRQARQRIRRAARGGAAVVVTGCAAHPAAGDAAVGAIPGVLLVEPDKDRLVERLFQRGVRNAERGVNGGAAMIPGDRRSALRIPRSALARSRALLKVQDGCPASCAYCIVPKVRPAVRSLAPQEAVRQLEGLIAAGFREVVLCGIHLGLYGADLEPRGSLPELLERLLAAPGLGRLRLSSIEPMEVSERCLALMAAEPDRLCPHLHVPLQSGDDEVLRQMGRPYASAEFLAAVERIRAALPLPAVTTDVLVGFPGESDEAFAATLGVMRAAALARVHVFPFSRRPGTRAAAMAGQVPGGVIRARRKAAAALGEALAAEYRAALVGRTARVVVEAILPDGAAEGLSERYVRVRLRGLLPADVRRRDFVRVRLVGIDGDLLLAEPIPG